MEKARCSVLLRPNEPQDVQLNSWKEIASYLKREVRTVRRWETFEALPVHRHLHKVRGSVYAFKTEIDSWWTNRRTQPRSASIILAVLPFENLDGEQKRGSLGLGLSAEVVTQLVRLDLPNLRVTDCSSMRFKSSTERIDKIAEKLGATHIIGGTIRSEVDRTFITVSLLKINDRTYVWAESYGPAQADAVIGEVEVSRQIARSVAAKVFPKAKILSSRVAGDSSIVQKACAEGRLNWNKRSADGLVKAISCFEHAISQDPGSSPAYAGLADSYLQLGFYGILPAAPAMKKAKVAALKAVELDDSSGEAHASLADVTKHFDWDFVGAEKEYQRAILLNPAYPTAHHWYGDYLAIMGRFDEAHAKGQHALELDPVSPIINTWVGMQFYLGGLSEEAVEQLRKTLGMHPNYALAHWALGLVYDQQLKYEKAIVEKQKAVSLSGESPWMLAALGCSYALSGKRSQTFRILDRLIGPAHQTYAISYEIATIYAALRDHDAAFSWLREAHKDHSAWVPFVRVEPRLRCLRGDKRFQQLTEQFNSVPM
jgi:TolB-like protein/tetratricopeptide (TPR) repeat protein